MVIIEFPIWAFYDNDTTNHKISTTRSLTVNNLLADDLVNIFMAIFNDSKQFPMFYNEAAYAIKLSHIITDMSEGAARCFRNIHMEAAVDINATFNHLLRNTNDIANYIPAPSPFVIHQYSK